LQQWSQPLRKLILQVEDHSSVQKAANSSAEPLARLVLHSLDKQET
jgi:hypothetical protein